MMIKFRKRFDTFKYPLKLILDSIILTLTQIVQNPYARYRNRFRYISTLSTPLNLDKILMMSNRQPVNIYEYFIPL